MPGLSLGSTVVAIVAVLVSSSARADKEKLRDFTEAVARDGCDGIPYSDLRGNCRDQQSYVHPWCDGGHGPVSCPLNVTKTLRVKLVHDQAKLSQHQDERRTLDDRRSRAADDAERARLTSEIEAIDKEVEATKRRIDDLAREMANHKYVVENTMATINKCIDYRKAVMNVFAYATDKVRSENDPDLKPLGEMLRSKYAEAIKGHQDAVDQKTNALNNCRDELP